MACKRDITILIPSRDKHCETYSPEVMDQQYLLLLEFTLRALELYISIVFVFLFSEFLERLYLGYWVSIVEAVLSFFLRTSNFVTNSFAESQGTEKKIPMLHFERHV